MYSYTEMIHLFTDIESIISFLYEMYDKHKKSCNVVVPHTTDICKFKCEKHLFLKSTVKKKDQ